MQCVLLLRGSCRYPGKCVPNRALAGWSWLDRLTKNAVTQPLSVRHHRFARRICRVKISPFAPNTGIRGSAEYLRKPSLGGARTAPFPSIAGRSAARILARVDRPAARLATPTWPGDLKSAPNIVRSIKEWKYNKARAPQLSLLPVDGQSETGDETRVGHKGGELFSSSVSRKKGGGENGKM